MMQRLADGLLALEALVKAGIGFELHERHFQRHDPAGGLVDRLEDRRHARSADDVGDSESTVENLAYFQFASHDGGTLFLVRG